MIHVLTDSRIENVESLLNGGQLEDARALMSEVVADFPEDHGAWFLYASCLYETGAVSDAVNAALRAWLLSEQQNRQAIHMAVKLIASELQDEVDLPIEDDPMSRVVALLRNAIAADPGPFRQNSGAV